ncbi:PrpF domain-containing protein [Radicibacter daui]|uniref:PrpF domain-containing protein n=1 Tax=Radicibacter daui TaxID=3064829 RepID=UPI00404703CC
MRQIRVPAVFMRGGTSKGLFFRADDLPADTAERDAIFKAALGSPDRYGRQLDGMGGGTSSTSKVMIVSMSPDAGADVDYLFAQVPLDTGPVDYAGNCGNLTAAVGPFAVESGLVAVADGEVALRLRNLNTGKIILSRFTVEEGEPVQTGTVELPGLSQPGAPVLLEFLTPGGSRTAGLLPTGRAVDTLVPDKDASIPASLVDASNPMVFVDAASIGLTALPPAMAQLLDSQLLDRLERLRRLGGVRMELGEIPTDIPASIPRLMLLFPPGPGADIGAITLSMGKPHAAIPVTAALCLAAAARIPSSIPERLRRRRQDEVLRIATPAGIVEARAQVSWEGGKWHAASASILRTARRLMEGAVTIPAAR